MATSPSTAANSRGRVQPSAASTPSSCRRPRTAAVAELATNSAQTTRISTNSATLLRSTASRIVIATPFLTQSSVSSSVGVPNLPDGSATVAGAGEDPATMSTVRWVRTSICSATALIRLREAGFGPVTPATRTRITLIGARASCALPAYLLFSSVGRAASVVMSWTGWLTRPPRLRLGSRSEPPSAFWLAALAGAAGRRLIRPSGTRDSGSKAAILLSLKVPASTGNTVSTTSATRVCCRSVRYWLSALSIGGS